MSRESRPSTVEFVVDGKLVRAEAGTSLAAALLNAGIWAFHSSVSGIARGPLCGMGVCFECRVTVEGVPHQRACLTAVAGGMRVQTGSMEMP
ncbi:MAG: (2Fe-2S)-binding protein [Gemmatimonadaceae bacterium]